MHDVLISLFGPIAFTGFVTWFIGLFNLDTKNKFCFFPGSINYTRILEGNINKAICNIDILTMIGKWANNCCENRTLSNHWWYKETPEVIQKSIDICVWNKEIKNMFAKLFSEDAFDIMIIDDMNEVYLTGKDRTSIHSDKVFFISHIDGPFSFIPYISVFRCLIGCNHNSTIETVFPMIPYKKKIGKGDILGFDFNREIHYIEEAPQNPFTLHKEEKDSRVTIKAHYCVYPKDLKYFAELTSYMNAEYNKSFRKLFLRTIKPENMYDYLSSYMVVYSTHMFVYSDIYIGHKNIILYSLLHILYNNYVLSEEGITSIYFFSLIYKIASFMNMSENDYEFYTFVRDVYILYVFVIINLTTIYNGIQNYPIPG